MRCLRPLLLLLGGCDRGELWKQKFVQEVNYHYQTQQIKNAEIDARDLEIENLKTLNVSLEGRIGALEKRVAGLEGNAPSSEPPPADLQARVTAMALEVDLVVFSAGRDAGVAVGQELWIHREGQTVAKAVVDRVEAKWSAAKLKEKRLEPKIGDAVRAKPPP